MKTLSLHSWALLVTAALLASCGGGSPEGAAGHDHDDEHGDHAAADEVPRGPHGGRLLADGAFVVELAIFENGVPPEYRAWVTQGGKPVGPSSVTLRVELGRLGGITDTIQFKPQADFLRGDREVSEPHSFDVHVTASHMNRSHSWKYESYEGRTVIPAEVAKTAGIETAVAGPGALNETVALYGAIAPDATRIREVRARFPGVIQSASKRVGETVRAGETLATVESNESLRVYAITAPISGVVTSRQAEPGEQTSDEPLFEIADFSRVWAELKVFPRDRALLKAGQRVQITAERMQPVAGTVSHVALTGERNAQSITARVVLENPTGVWTVGQFVEGVVTVSQAQVPMVVPLSALQTFRDFNVVYAQVADTYEVRMLELGRRDTENVEVLGGLQPGTRYVIRNSYLIKADIEKSGASHDH